jgi:hypothetical protein
MPSVGLEPTIPVFKRAKTIHALDRAATVIGPSQGLLIQTARHQLRGKDLYTNYPGFNLHYMSNQKQTWNEILGQVRRIYTPVSSLYSSVYGRQRGVEPEPIRRIKRTNSQVDQ